MNYRMGKLYRDILTEEPKLNIESLDGTLK